jgi:hypothetical protein
MFIVLSDGNQSSCHCEASRREASQSYLMAYYFLKREPPNHFSDLPDFLVEV